MSYINVLFPKQNAKISLLKPLVRKYIKDNKKAFRKLKEDVFDDFDKGVYILNYNTKEKLSVPKPVNIKFETDLNCEFVLHLWSDDNILNIINTTKYHSFKVYNLIPQKKYFFYISTKDEKVNSSINSFEIIDAHRFIHTKQLNNVRDIGGKYVSNGKMIKYGLLFRGPEIITKTYHVNVHGTGYISQTHCKSASKVDIKDILDLGVKFELDLRGYEESNKNKKSVLSSKNNKIGYLRVDNACAYGDLFKFNSSFIKEVFECIANYEDGAIYLHCWGGADRTGSICFLLEAMLGAKLSDLVIDYECTSFFPTVRRVGKYVENVEQSWQAGDVNFYAMIKLFMDYKKDNETIQQTITRFLIEKCGVSINIIEKIRNRYLTNID